MKLQQLETFFWVVKLGSFAAAATRLHATQSTISMRIRELEKSLGVELFDRSQRSAKLTPKGSELMGYAERLLDMATELEAARLHGGRGVYPWRRLRRSRPAASTPAAAR